MKIAIDCRLLCSKISGIGNYVLELINGLSAIDKANNYKLIYNQSLRSKAKPYAPEGNFRICNIPISVRLLDNLILRFRIPKVDWFTGRIDVMHSTSFFPWTVSRGKKILTVHDLSSFRTPEVYSPRLSEYYRRCFKLSIPNYDFIIADSKATKSDIIDIFKIPEQKIRVIYLGTHHQKIPIKPITGKNTNVEYPYILCVSTLETRKNQIRLIKAYSTLKKRYKIPHKLILAGAQGWGYEEIIKEYHNTPDKDNIILTGYLSCESLISLYRNASIFAYISLYEGFGLPLLEAMSYGIPVVYANNSSMPEVVGDAGVPVNAYDIESITEGIYKMISNQQLAQNSSKKGIIQAANFTWNKTIEDTLKVYQDVGNLSN